MKSIIAGLVGGFLLLTGAPVDAQNLISNESFETPLVPPSNFTDFPVGSVAITGWTVFGPGGTAVAIVSGSFATLGVTFPAQSGNQWLDLTGGGSNSTEGVSQTIATVLGRQYQLSYFIGNTTGGGGALGTTSTVDVIVNGGVAFTDTNAASSLTTQVWQQFTHAIVATGASTTLAFRNLDPPSDNLNGLDNIVLIDQGEVGLDIDGDGSTQPLTDGLLVLRFLFGFTGGTLVAGAVDPDCTRCDAAAIEPYLELISSLLNVDGNPMTDALTDGLLVLRYLFGFTGATLITSAVGAGCTRCDAPMIEAYLAGLSG